MFAASSITRLKSNFRGELLMSGDDNYDIARKVFNAMIDRRPALIARCTCPEDVVQAVNFARAEEPLVSVRCAGHNVAGFAVCDDGLVIDLSPMKKISVDAPARRVRAEAGLTWGEVSDALQPYGLAATGGFVSVTGVAGLTLGGGLGWLVRKHGLALDNLVSAEIVLANGRLVRASASEHEDLFWAIRGGGGNFGVVTSFEFRAHPAGTVLAGTLVHPAASAGAVLRTWRDFEMMAPEELTQGALLFHFPDDPSLPAPLRGSPVIGIGGVYTGNLEEGEKVLAPLRAYGPPIADLFQQMPYNAAQRSADFLWPSGLHNYWKSSYLDRFSDECVAVITDFFARVPSKRSVIVLESIGNCVLQRVPESATAFGHRRWPFNFLVTSAWSDPAEADVNIAWTRAFFDSMRPFLADAAYVNYMGDEGATGLRAAYGAEKFGRLSAIKAKYDPMNLFRMNQNIAPRTVA